MAKITRFGVSLEDELLRKFDKLIRRRKYTKRSEAIRDLIREALIKEEWRGKGRVAGVITLVFDHHKRELVNRLTDIQHDYQDMVISAQHIHLDHDNCLEMIAVRGNPERISELKNKLRSAKGVKFGSLTMATTGGGVE
ncbi:MAG: nickel-responsive transcriptional regulator NikR [Candidatus Omnitrophota bacterium]